MTTSKGRVLVVDDERANVVLTAIRLRTLGYEVFEAAGGEEALAMLRSLEVDLVLSDVRMPVVDGFELVRRIRGEATLEGLPVVLVTGYDGPEERTHGLDVGADDFLAKPVNLAELQLRVQAQVRLHRLRRELRHRGRILQHPDVESAAAPTGSIFVLEDDEQWSTLLIDSLRAAGHAVESAADLATGIAAIARAEPDVLLVDLGLPDGNGLQVIRRFRDVTRGRQAPAILVVTAVDDEAQKLDCLRLGADDFVSKPISPMEVVARVGSQMRRIRASALAANQVERALGDAYTDALTGLYNRRYLDEDLLRRVSRAGARDGSFAVALLDVDHFKRINDTWGHPAGDAVLRTVAQQIRKYLRTGDLECRYGGEEFVVILPTTSLADAALVAERLRSGMESCELPSPLAGERITASLGVAGWAPGEDAASLLRRADQALYVAKRGGRNRVELAAVAPT